jgi:hypothetical protein
MENEIQEIPSSLSTLASDHVVMVTLVTALLQRAGGHVTFTAQEWDAAIEHEGSLFLSRQDRFDDTQVYLMKRTVHD